MCTVIRQVYAFEDLYYYFVVFLSCYISGTGYIVFLCYHAILKALLDISPSKLDCGTAPLHTLVEITL